MRQLHRRTRFFFFQAEDGIRDRNVTGVQTCALPISLGSMPANADVANQLVKFLIEAKGDDAKLARQSLARLNGPGVNDALRSEERRVGKECRSRWSAYQ